MGNRYRHFMYEQQIKQMKVPMKDLEDILKKSGASEWAFCVHDSDIKDSDSGPIKVEDHVHVVLKYQHPQLLSSIAKIFKDNDQQVTKWTGRINNAYSYLIHATSNADSKYKYSVNNVKASFDFAKRIERIGQSVSYQNVNEALNMFSEGEYDLSALRQAIGIRAYAKAKKQIEDIRTARLEIQHLEWLEEFENQKCEVVYIYGPAGAGKTVLANQMTAGEKVAVLGSMNDMFQEYEGERVVIFNDLRPNDIAWADLLRILDPYEHHKQAPRRYHNLPLNLEKIYITTPYSPQDFYKYSRIQDRSVDTFEQLERRLDQVVDLP